MISKYVVPALALLVMVGCSDAPIAPRTQITIEQLPAAELDALHRQEQAELARIEDRRAASDAILDSLQGAWQSMAMGWGQRGRLLVCSPRDYDGAVRIIGPEGGEIVSGNARLRIPPGALDRPTVITVETPVAYTVVAEFRPHGLQFRERPVLSMNYAHCLRPKWMRESVAYLDENDGVVEWPESRDRSGSDEVDALLNHFSRYAVAF